MRILVVGDIHGNERGLVNVLDAANYQKEYDQLIFLGDYVDGWSDSFGVIEFLLEIEKQAIVKPIFIRGNHDVWCEEFLYGKIDNHWLSQGGTATVKSYTEGSGHLKNLDDHLSFFRRLHNYYIDEENRGFVHGGFVSHKGLGHDPYQSNYYWDRDLWTIVTILNRTKDTPVAKSASRFMKHKEIFIGHTSTTAWNCKPHYPEYKHPKQPTLNGKITIPMNRRNVWNLDTGGGFDGKLTIMDIDSKEFWQADYTKNLYPNEMGHYKR
jgi:serine/threonine protein phosphatase 1